MCWQQMIISNFNILVCNLKMEIFFLQERRSARVQWTMRNVQDVAQSRLCIISVNRPICSVRGTLKLVGVGSSTKGQVFSNKFK